MNLKDEYLARTGGDELQGAAALAFDLMQGDPETFKQGYTLENAAWAAADVFGLDRASVEDRLRVLVTVR